MKKLLITGFEPFGGESINPSWEAVSLLPSQIGEYTVNKLLVPVEFSVGAEAVKKEADRWSPDVIISVGQAGGRAAVSVEMVGLNLRYASIPDNGGNQPRDIPVIEGEEAAIFTTLPARRMAERIANEGIPAVVSYSAGAYVCNDLFYTLLSCYKGTQTKVGFIHIPYSKEQGKEPSMELESLVRALAVAIESISED